MKNEKMTIVHITTGLGMGGAEKLVFDLCNTMDRNKFDMHVAAVVFGGPYEQKLREIGIPAHVFNKKTKLGLSTLFEIKKYLQVIHPDIVHTHTFGGDAWGRIAAWLAGVPVIIMTEHNVSKDEGLVKSFVKWALSFITDAIIGISDAVIDYSHSHDHIARSKFIKIYNGIPIEQFPFRGLKPVNDDSIRIGMVGRLHEQKGQIYAIRALPHIIKRYPSAVLEIVGEGALRDSLEAEAMRLRVEKFITFLGARHDDIPGYLKTLDLFLFPSVWEGLGLAALEAQAIGVPVLASRVDGITEIITDKETGILFDSQSPEAIVEAVIWAVEHPQEREGIVTRARKNVEQQFTLEKMVRGYITVYEELLGKIVSKGR